MLIKNKNVHILTLGCKVNAFESNAINQQFVEHGAKIVEEIERAHICVINTCCVTAKAESKSRYFINRAIRSKLCELIIVVGCSSQLDKNLFTHPKIGIVLGTKHKSSLLNVLNDYQFGKKIVMVEPLGKKEVFEHFEQDIFLDNTRAYLKIQDGCDYFCSYCLIPLVRGRQRSLEHKEILRTISSLVKKSYKEIILTGVNTAGYYEKKNYGFYELLKDIDLLPGNFRIRISSVEPFQINKKIIDLITAHPNRWCQHLHICLQNANDKILKDMKRKYSFEEYMILCNYILSKNRLFSITTDYIVGFATETRDLFMDTVHSLKTAPLAHMHIFPYSQRPHTAASLLKNLVSDTEKRIRFKMLEEINNE
jgi:threonylcarbamoyladenosine tRNA methylthiotransferase MtaB